MLKTKTERKTKYNIFIVDTGTVKRRNIRGRKQRKVASNSPGLKLIQRIGVYISKKYISANKPCRKGKLVPRRRRRNVI